MSLAIGVKFKRNGPLAYYDPAGDAFALGDHVLADTARGPEIGEVVLAPAEIAEALLPAELKPVIRRATADDLSRRRALEEEAPEHVRVAKERVHAFRLDMKVIAATSSFDGNRILFDFSADGRIDFRELARDLAAIFQCRVELRQIFPRDESKLQDGYGPCGRRLCCSSWLKEFQPVSIKHAKEQGLPLNPAKLNGMCGKLKCCLVYENDQYVELKSKLPRPGQIVEVAEGSAVVRDINVPRELVSVQLEATGAVLAIPAAELELEVPVPPVAPAPSGRRRRRRGGGGGGGGGGGAAPPPG
ncbi:MAG TPA: regulatory iron-sulfur-containing complex subunit RicT [Candidatus Dormibacteraeota bacterium]|jgi:cell fate regulator YaaT (PSP1 superfamily)|nr:regulatory iron-sulfur-containing complex subunit RicT [Candidatus Dormibacteraeota bacterium]